jgi:CubicO group peptidase (beta-lactamase class C family)
MRFVLPIAVLGLWVSCSAAGESLDTRAIDAMVREGMEAWQVPGAALAIVRDDQVEYLQGYGIRQVGGKEKVTPDTLFAIASLSKAFTATAVGLLVDEGKMSWDDPVHRHLEWVRLADPCADQGATLRDLLCHRAGMAGHSELWADTTLGRDAIVRRIGHLPLEHPFRSTFHYNNILYVAVGQAVGAASQETWDDFVEKRLFAPLGMTSAKCSAKAAQRRPNHASPHNRGKKGQARLLLWDDYLDIAGPAGSIHASARDMARWVRFQLGDGAFEGKRIVSARTLAETHTPQMVVRKEGEFQVAYPDSHQISDGLGWFLHDYRGHFLVSHTGGLRGFRSRLVLVPEKKLGVVLLLNSGVGSSYASAHYVITNRLLDLLLGLPRKSWNDYYRRGAEQLENEGKKAIRERERGRHANTRPSLDLAAYAGVYTHPAYGKVIVTSKDGSLGLAWSRCRARLDHFHFDTFVAHGDGKEEENPLDEETIAFVLQPDGTVGGLRLFGQELGRARQ